MKRTGRLNQVKSEVRLVEESNLDYERKSYRQYKERNNMCLYSSQNINQVLILYQVLASNRKCNGKQDRYILALINTFIIICVNS